MQDALLRDMDANTILQAPLASSYKSYSSTKWRDEQYECSNFGEYWQVLEDKRRRFGANLAVLPYGHDSASNASCVSSAMRRYSPMNIAPNGTMKVQKDGMIEERLKSASSARNTLISNTLGNTPSPTHAKTSASGSSNTSVQRRMARSVSNVQPGSSSNITRNIRNIRQTSTPSGRNLSTLKMPTPTAARDRGHAGRWGEGDGGGADEESSAVLVCDLAESPVEAAAAAAAAAPFLNVPPAGATCTTAPHHLAHEIRATTNPPHAGARRVPEKHHATTSEFTPRTNWSIMPAAGWSTTARAPSNTRGSCETSSPIGQLTLGSPSRSPSRTSSLSPNGAWTAIRALNASIASIPAGSARVLTPDTSAALTRRPLATADACNNALNISPEEHRELRIIESMMRGKIYAASSLASPTEEECERHCGEERRAPSAVAEGDRRQYASIHTHTHTLATTSRTTAHTEVTETRSSVCRMTG